MERDKLVVINFLPFKINGYGPLPYIICWGKLKRWKVWNGKFALTRCPESASDFLGMIPPRPLPLPVTYPCNLTKSLWSHRPRKKKWKKLDGKMLIFHLTQYLQQNWWYHKEMLVCINQKKFRNAKLGTWKGVLELNWHWMLGTWRPQRGIVSGCLVFCHFFCEKICDPKMPMQKRWQISGPNIGDMKSKDSALTASPICLPFFVNFGVQFGIQTSCIYFLIPIFPTSLGVNGALTASPITRL